MYPASGNDHSISGIKGDFDNLVNHITQPYARLYFCPGPPLVRSQICRGGSDEVKYLCATDYEDDTTTSTEIPALLPLRM